MLVKLLRLTAGGVRRHDVILSGVAYPTAILVHVAHRLFRIPFVVYSYGEDVTCVQDDPRGRKQLGAVLSSARTVMTISRFTMGRIAELGVPSSRISLIPPGIDAAPYDEVSPEAEDELRERLGVGGRRVILTLARLAPRKGHDVVIRSLKGLLDVAPDLHYLIVGKGDPSALRGLADAEGVSDHVTFVEYVPDEDLPALFRIGDIYTMVSRWDPVAREVEGFGIVYLEAAASGRPSVAGAHGGSPDAVEDGVTGFVVDPTSVEAVQGALRTLLMDKERASAMGEAGKKRVRQEFDRKVLLQRIEQVLSFAVAPSI